MLVPFTMIGFGNHADIILKAYKSASPRRIIGWSSTNKSLAGLVAVVDFDWHYVSLFFVESAYYEVG